MSKKVELSLDTLAAIVDNMRDELLVVDREYRIVYVNNVCRRHYGKTKEELIGTRIWFGVKANDPTKTLAPAVFPTSAPWSTASTPTPAPGSLPRPSPFSMPKAR